MNDYQRVQALPGWFDAIKPYSEAFQRALLFVLAHENEYHPDGTVKTEHDPKDSGGTTKWGIDQASHPLLDIENLTLEEAVQSYHNDEWKRAHGDALPEALAICHFDGTVNIGETPSAKMLQAVVGAVIVDGKVGPKTLASASAVDSPLHAALAMLERRKTYYTRLRQFPRYGRGWLNRVEDLRQFISSC